MGDRGVTTRPPSRRSLTALPALELLGNSPELSSSRLTDADVEAIVEALLAAGVSVEGVFLWYNEISDAGAAALARLFQARL